MYPKVVRIKVKDKSYPYLRLVESYREGGKVKQRTLANLGNLNALKKKRKIDSLIRSLIKISQKEYFRLGELKSKKTFRYADAFLIRHLWEKLELDWVIQRSLREKKIEFDLNLATLIMVVNRLLAPRSKLAVTRWQKKIYLPEPEKNKLGYQHFWRTLDHLAGIKRRIELHLFHKICDLFSLKVNLIFYDITSTYFEGGSSELARFGYSRDRRADKKQILLGLVVTDEGIPIAHEVFEGNLADKSTLKGVVEDLKRRFSIKRCIFVCDRGMVSKENIDYLESEDYEYIVSLKKRRSKEVKAALESSPSQYERLKENLFVKEVRLEDTRYLIYYNPEKAQNDRSFRENLIERQKKKLERLKMMVKRGRLKRKKLILSRALQILGSAKGSKKYFSVFSEDDGKFSFQIKQKVLSAEEALDGIHLLKTNCQDLANLEINRAYKELSQVEDAFREMKDFLKIRPIYHHIEIRVRAHVLICALAYTIEKILDRELADKNIDLSAREAFELLDEVRLVENQVADKKIKCVTEIAKEHSQVLKALGIKALPRTILT